jgi:hypothetical protein
LALHWGQDDDVADKECPEEKRERVAPIVADVVDLPSVEAACQQAYGWIAP